MKLVGRVPVEPLDDERMTHIERRVVSGAADAAARPMRAPRRFTAIAVAAMAAVVAGVIGWKLGSRPAPVVVGDSAPLTIDTEAQRSTIDIGDATIQSDPATIFSVTRPAGGVLVDMTRGKVELEVGKRGDRAPLVVRAGETDVIVVGTHFSVDYGDGTGDVDVRVTEGVVKVVRNQQEVRVAAGQAWQTRRGALALADARKADGVRGAGTSGTGANATGASGTGTSGTNSSGANDTGTGSNNVVASNDPVHGGSGIEIEMGSGPDLLHGRTSLIPDKRVAGNTGAAVVSPPDGANSTTVARAGGTGGMANSSNGGSTGGTNGGGSGARQPTIDPKDPMRDLKKLIVSQPLEAPLDVGESNPASAISAYQKIIRETDGEEESQAFYSIAVLQQGEAINRRSDALRTLEGYFQRYSTKRYPQFRAALWLRMRLVCQTKIDDSCRQLAYKYAHEFPGTPAAAIAERISLTD